MEIGPIVRSLAGVLVPRVVSLAADQRRTVAPIVKREGRARRDDDDTAASVGRERAAAAVAVSGKVYEAEREISTLPRELLVYIRVRARVYTVGRGVGNVKIGVISARLGEKGD